MTKEELGKNIRQLRELKGFTQQNLSDAIEISQKSLSRIESGQNSPTFELLQKICIDLKIELFQLLDFNEQTVYNSYTLNKCGGEFKEYNNTNVAEIVNLYERLIKEKDDLISFLKK
jgi:transcriptional regulator with XRE-family HTH domain